MVVAPLVVSSLSQMPISMLRRCSTVAGALDCGEKDATFTDDTFNDDPIVPLQEQLLQIRLLACARGVYQMARICMGPLSVNIAAEYGYSPEQKGQILSAFAAGYAMTQILGGLVADRVGGKPLLLLGLLTSGGSLLLLPLAADVGIDQLWWLLWIMGLMQGPTYPAQIATTALWATASIRSYASALAGAGSTAGSLLALGLTPLLAERVGWRRTSLVFGVLTLLFGFLEAFYGLSRPRWARRARPRAESREGINVFIGKLQRWCKILLAPSVLAIYAAHASHNFVRYFLMAWMPSYYREVLLVSADAAGLHLVIPELCGLISSVAGTSLGTQLQQRGTLSPLSSRRLFASVAFIGSFVGLILISFVTKAGLVTLCLCSVQGLATLQGLGFGANYLDISRHNGGLVTGVGNTVATCASFFGPVVASWLLPSSGTKGPEVWQRLFLVFGCSNLVGLALFLPFCSVSPVDVEKEESKRN